MDVNTNTTNPSEIKTKNKIEFYLWPTKFHSPETHNQREIINLELAIQQCRWIHFFLSENVAAGKEKKHTEESEKKFEASVWWFKNGTCDALGLHCNELRNFRHFFLGIQTQVEKKWEICCKWREWVEIEKYLCSLMITMESGDSKKKKCNS